MNHITDALYWLSTGLLVPVIVMLLVLFARALLMAGSFFGAFMGRRAEERRLKIHLDALSFHKLEDFYKQLPSTKTSLYARYARLIIEARFSEAHSNKHLSMFELEADKQLSASKTLSKMGPVLGLMGTLIPMGPALLGLTTGDISAMAYNMQVAFATTVIGLATGAVGYITHQVKQRWFLKDQINLEFLHKIIAENRVKVCEEIY